MKFTERDKIFIVVTYYFIIRKFSPSYGGGRGASFFFKFLGTLKLEKTVVSFVLSPSETRLLGRTFLYSVVLPSLVTDSKL